MNRILYPPRMLVISVVYGHKKTLGLHNRQELYSGLKLEKTLGEAGENDLFCISLVGSNGESLGSISNGTLVKVYYALPPLIRYPETEDISLVDYLKNNGYPALAKLIKEGFVHYSVVVGRKNSHIFKSVNLITTI